MLAKFGDDDGTIEFDVAGIAVVISMHKTFLSLLLIRATTAAVVVLGSLFFPGDTAESPPGDSQSDESKKNK